MHFDLASLVADRLAATGMSLRAFAKVVGLTPSYVSKVLRGHRPLGRERVAGWARALGLDQDGIDEFAELVLIGHCPEEVRVALLALRRGPGWPGIRPSTQVRRRTRRTG